MSNPLIALQNFTFDVVTVDAGGQSMDFTEGTSEHFLEHLGDAIFLDMVLIPGGDFLMGSPDDELGRLEWEGPQHHVNVSSFFMGRYPVTQAQWRNIVEACPRVNIRLQVDPSLCKGPSHPVENVSWYEAMEFCARLSLATGRDYRLPSEAEWEYACRAGTTSRFHFGDTLTPELVNIGGEYIDAAGPSGLLDQRTTRVGYYKVANRYGLYDMHGNVWEWCLDTWHRSYQGAPLDGRPWLSTGVLRICRGGCWGLNAAVCRSGERSYRSSFNDIFDMGLRVVCSFP